MRYFIGLCDENPTKASGFPFRLAANHGEITACPFFYWSLAPEDA